MNICIVAILCNQVRRARAIAAERVPPREAIILGPEYDEDPYGDDEEYMLEDFIRFGLDRNQFDEEFERDFVRWEELQNFNPHFSVEHRRKRFRATSGADDIFEYINWLELNAPEGWSDNH